MSFQEQIDLSNRISKTHLLIIPLFEYLRSSLIRTHDRKHGICMGPLLGQHLTL
jgi:hypothetical protein